MITSLAALVFGGFIAKFFGGIVAVIFLFGLIVGVALTSLFRRRR